VSIVGNDIVLKVWLDEVQISYAALPFRAVPSSVAPARGTAIGKRTVEFRRAGGSEFAMAYHAAGLLFSGSEGELTFHICANARFSGFDRLT